MFKTINECGLELVAHSVMVNNHPYISHEEYTADMGNCDFFPCSAARVSFGKEDKTGKDEAADRKLMKYLADHEHMTPFEHQSATFLVEVPLFIRSQIMRHRTFAYNEISRRYTSEDLDFWVPDEWRGQSESNRQASSDVRFPVGVDFRDGYYSVCSYALSVYQSMIDDMGVAREQARSMLPQSLLTRFYMTGNLRNWAHFVKLRVDDHAQYEVRVVAERIDEALGKLWPTAWGVLRDA